jgi:hypothetical protein
MEAGGHQRPKTLQSTNLCVGIGGTMDRHLRGWQCPESARALVQNAPSPNSGQSVQLQLRHKYGNCAGIREGEGQMG